MNEGNELFILWTNADPVTAEKMVMMYAVNSKLHGWWKEVTVILWGAPAKLVAESPVIQEKIQTGILAGVRFSACKACADQLGVTERLEAMGIEVIYWGEGLTGLLKEGKKLLTV